LNEAIAVRNPGGENCPLAKSRITGSPSAPSHQVRSEPATEIKEIFYGRRLTGNTALGPKAAVSNEVVVLKEGVVAIALRSHDQEVLFMTWITVVYCEFSAITPGCDGMCLVESQGPNHDVEVGGRHHGVQRAQASASRR
jgi:hypothetical protein